MATSGWSGPRAASRMRRARWCTDRASLARSRANSARPTWLRSMATSELSGPRAAQGGQCVTQVVQLRGHVGVVRAEGGFVDAQGPLVQGQALAEATVPS